jgi:hypothetical protein
MSSCKNPVEEVVVDFTYETESPDGDKTIHAYALDGRILLITKPNPTKLAELKKAEALLSSPTPNTLKYHPDDEQNLSSRPKILIADSLGCPSF